MIEIITFTRDGDLIDRAEAADPESAVIAARTLLRDARPVNPHATASFYVDGKLVRTADSVGLGGIL